MFTDFRKKTTLGKVVTMATRKRLFLIYKIENFANTQFWKVTKFQGASLFRCGVLSHLLGMGWKTPPPPPVLIGLRPRFHYTADATTTTQKQSDYKVEQSCFTLIALFWLEIGRCRGRNWLDGNQA